MCSYQNIGSADHGNLHFENCEELWANNPATPVIQTDPEQNVNFTTSHQDYQMQTSAGYHAESSSLLSPLSWTDSTFEAPQNSMSMSTYFSTFNPLSQLSADLACQQNPVLTSPFQCLKTQNSARREKHCARISLVPSGNGSLKAIVKRKRKRTTFTTEQLEVLEEVFSKKPYVTRDERQILVNQLQVNDKSIKVWFQNRRLKNKRGDESDEMTLLDKNAIFERLDSVESKINERTDEYGYVTLDDKIMSDLVNVIDDYFANNVSPVETKLDTDSSPIYEPISPVSTSDYSCDENASSWQHHDTYETVQKLIDIESVLLSK